MLLHDELEKCQAVHLGHLDVESDHIRLPLEAFVPRHVGVRVRPHDTDFGIYTQRISHDFSDHHGVVNDQNFYLAIEHIF